MSDFDATDLKADRMKSPCIRRCPHVWRNRFEDTGWFDRITGTPQSSPPNTPPDIPPTPRHRLLRNDRLRGGESQRRLGRRSLLRRVAQADLPSDGVERLHYADGFLGR